MVKLSIAAPDSKLSLQIQSGVKVKSGVMQVITSSIFQFTCWVLSVHLRTLHVSVRSKLHNRLYDLGRVCFDCSFDCVKCLCLLTNMGIASFK